MSVLDELRKRRANNFVSFKPDIYMDVRKDKDSGKAMLTYWSKENEKLIGTSKPVDGFYLGYGFVMEAFDSKFGNKGGTYKTSVYFKKTDNVNLYNPIGNKETRMPAGDMEASIASYTESAVTVKKKLVLYLVSREKGTVMAISTNVSIGIEQIQNLVSNQSVNDYWIKVFPAVYSTEDTSLKKCHKYLGPLAVKNPPNYARIEISDPLDNENLSAINAVEKLDEFEAWKKAISEQQDISSEQETAPVANVPKSPAAKQVETPEEYQDDNNSQIGEEDDLPF